MLVLAKIKNVVLAAVMLFLAVGFTSAQNVQHYNSPLYNPRPYEGKETLSSNGLPKELQEVGIEQKLNSQLPLDLPFKDENGKDVKLGDYFGNKPIIVAPVYYECPMLCNEVLNGLSSSLKGMTFVPGKEFEIVAISFDPRDTPEIARSKKETYVAKYGRPETASAWHFLTGTPESIKAFTESIGFKYYWDEKSKQFAHAGGVMVATPEGKLARYYYGIEYAPKEIKFGLIEAADRKIGNPVDQLLLYCYHYDPSTGKYGFAIINVVRIGGVLTLLGLAVMMIGMWRYNSNKKDGAEKAALS